MSSPVPVSLIVDDGGPVNMFYFHQLQRFHELLVPVAFARKFAAVCERNGVKGKFSVVPMPAGLGRLDGKVNLVPPRTLRSFIEVVRERIAPNFSLTPEILTHFRAYDLKRNDFRQVFEDVWFSTLSAPEIADYVALAVEILNNAGLTPAGVTSPWYTGIDNEANYASGIGMAFKRVLKRDRCFYFLHSRDHVVRPTVMCDTPESGRVVSIPANSSDAFWGTQNPATPAAAAASARRNIDALLSADGRTGTLRELYEAGLPLTLITHWQSLFSDGRAIGLEGLETLVRRINKIFGSQVEWLTFGELAEKATPINQ